MYKILFYFIFPIILLSNNKIDTKITYNKKILQSKINDKEKTNIAIKKLANKINTEESRYTKINENLIKISDLLSINKKELTAAQNKVNILEKQSLSLKSISEETEKKIVNSIIENYSISISKNLLNKESINDIINKEKYEILLDTSKDKILKSNLKYFKIQNEQKNNYIKINKLKEYIKLQNLQKEKYNLLKQKQEKSLHALKNNYKLYKNKLKKIILKQNKINKLLDDLDILKLKELRKEKLRALKKTLKKKKEKLNKKAKLKKLNFTSKVLKTSKKVIKIKEKAMFKDEIDLNVKKYGSSMNGIKLSRYNGIRTIAPLKKYKIVKKFGKYYDPIYKIELFNESISLKSSIKNAKVHSVLKGKVVYAKNDASTLGSVVIVKHSKGLHTVYSQLSNIPKSLKVGKWIPKGYVVGRIKNTLIFQATKNSRYINPVKLFK